MSAAAVARDHRFLVPEVIQTSMMDCGPASLKSLLDGFGIDVSYGRLREACQTDVDGTSIDVMEDVANQLGLQAEQQMVPTDHLLAPESEALPAIAVVRLPTGSTHFVVIWRSHGRVLQVMDPAVGRRWMSREQFLTELYVHRTNVPAEAWREWASSGSFLDPLRRRIRALGVGRRDRNGLIERALADPSWRSLAALDASTRMLESLARAGAFARTGSLGKLLQDLSSRGPDIERIPERYWTALPSRQSDGGEEQVSLRGAVIVRVSGRSSGPPAPNDESQVTLSPELIAALRETTPSPWRELLRALRETGLTDPVTIVTAAVLAAAGVLVQALLFRALIDLGYALGIAPQRLGALGALFVFFAAMLFVQIPVAASVLRTGRHLETLLRLRFLRKIPRISDRYFHSRLLSDMAERCHALALLRDLPSVAYDFWRSLLQLALTAIGLVWLERQMAIPAAVIVVSSLVMSWLSQRVLNERDLRARSHGAALTRYYLDALIGLVAIRAHGAERAIAREQENILVQWTDSQLRLQRAAVVVDGLQAVVSLSLSIWVVFGHVVRVGQSGSVLLVAYWALQLPVLAQGLAAAARQAPPLRNVMLRLLEPLSAPEESDDASADLGPAGELARDPYALILKAPLNDDKPPESTTLVQPIYGGAAAVEHALRGMRIELFDVSVRAGGHTLLDAGNLDIEASSHVAIVGASGAGKSTLLGLLLGWHRPATGEIRIDGDTLSQPRIVRLRRETAWVDPSVTLHNRRFLDNLTYGARSPSPQELGWVIDSGELREIVERLPDGLQTTLGEGGALVSGGEGQRIRLGRAMLRPTARLVLLDEPFRGLDREKRRLLLRRTRELWGNSTLLCVTHDIRETLSFPRVLVVDHGRIIEDGDPNFLTMDPSSVFYQLLQAETQVREGLWANAAWRRVRVERGRILEQGGHGRPPPANVTDPFVNFAMRFGRRGGES